MTYTCGTTIKWEYDDDDDEFVVRVFGDFVCPQLKEATNP